MLEQADECLLRKNGLSRHKERGWVQLLPEKVSQTLNRKCGGDIVSGELESILKVAWGKPLGLPKRRQLRRHFFMKRSRQLEN